MTTNVLSFRHRLALSGLVIGPVLLAVEEFVRPDSGDGAYGIATAVAAAPHAWLAGWTLALLGSAALVAGVSALSAHVSRRGAGLTTAGLILFGAGAMGFVGLAASELVLVPVVGDDPGAVVAVVERMNESAALAVVFLLYLPGWFLGLPVLLGGLWRAGVAPWWSLPAAVASVLSGFVLSSALGEYEVVASLLLLFAFVPVLGRIRMSV